MLKVARRLVRAPWWGGVALVLGCAPEQSSVLNNDPLVGGPGARSVATTPLASATRPSGVVPALPAPTPGGGTASLASGRGLGTLDPTRELRIGRDGAGSSVPSVRPAVSLEGPQPLSVPSSVAPIPVPPEPRTAIPAIPTSNTPPPALSYEQLKARLTERGLIWMKTESSVEKNEVKLTCFVSSRTKPNEIQSHEVTARDEVAALRALLETMERTP